MFKLKIGWIYRFVSHTVFLFEKKKACIYYTSTSWDPTNFTPLRESYYSGEFNSTITSMPKEKPFLVIAQDNNHEDIYQVLCENQIGWIRYRQWVAIDTSLNP